MRVARSILRALQPLVPNGSGLTVLAYHLVGAGTDSAVDLPEDMFRDQLDELVVSAEVVPLLAGLEALRGGRPGGGRPFVALTFDDAYANFVDRAWPLLAERDLSATLFVPVGFVAGDCPPPNTAAPLPAASWADLAALVASGRLTVGSHTWTHPDLTRLDDAAVDEELIASRCELENRLAVDVAAFCYPRALWSPRVERRVARVYEVAMIGGGGRTRQGHVQPLRVQRVSLRRDGPRKVDDILSSRLWLEERAADYLRRWRR